MRKGIAPYGNCHADSLYASSLRIALQAAVTSKTNGNGKANASSTKMDIDSQDEEDEKPLGVATGMAKSTSKKTNGSSSKSKAKQDSPLTSDDDDDEPLAATVTSRASSPGTKRQSRKKDESDEEAEEDDDDEEKYDDDDEEGEDGSQPKKPAYTPGRGTKKWETLYHTGPRFPPPYEPLPSHIKLTYDGKPLDLPPESEEAAMFYAVKLETQHARNPIFNKNFFKDFKNVLKHHPPSNKDSPKIEKFEKLDFRPMYEYWRALKDAEAERKKALAPSARKKELEEKKKAEAAMKTCIVDGLEQKVGNVMVEPPAVFLGRGAHPKTGMIKQRIRPEQITINHTLDDPKHPPPPPPPGHKWKDVIEDKHTTWLAFWQENVNGQHKYMYLDATSHFKTNSDKEKYEKARRLDVSAGQADFYLKGGCMLMLLACS